MQPLPHERAAGVCGPYKSVKGWVEFMGIFEKNKQGLEEAIDYENEVYDKLREAEREAESTLDEDSGCREKQMM